MMQPPPFQTPQDMQNSETFLPNEHPKRFFPPNLSLMKNFFLPFRSFSFSCLFVLLLIGGTVLATKTFLLAFLLSFYGLAVFDQTAAGYKNPEDFNFDFDEFDFWDALIRYLWIAYLVFLSGIPGTILSQSILFCSGWTLTAENPVPALIVLLICTQGSLLIFMPVLALSGLSNENSPFNVFENLKDISSVLFRPLRKTMLKFYLISALFGILTMFGNTILYLIINENITADNYVGFFLLQLFLRSLFMICSIFFYFRLLGRFAFICSRYLKKTEESQE